MVISKKDLMAMVRAAEHCVPTKDFKTFGIVTIAAVGVEALIDIRDALVESNTAWKEFNLNTQGVRNGKEGKVPHDGEQEGAGRIRKSGRAASRPSQQEK